MYSPYERTLHGYEIVEEGIDQEQTAHGYEDADPYTDALVSDESLSKSDGQQLSFFSPFSLYFRVLGALGSDTYCSPCFFLYSIRYSL